MADNKYLIGKVQSPALPVAPVSPLRVYLDDLNNIIRLFFNKISNSVNLVTGSNGARFIDTPNGLFFDTGDQAIEDVNVAQPVRFNQTYLSNAVTINGLTTSEITVTYSGVYNFQFTGQVRSTSGSSKLIFVWLRRSTVDVGYSAREYSVSGSGKELEISWNFNIDLQAGQYIQIMWAADDADLQLDTVAASSPHPGIPSAVVAVTLVSTLPDPLPTLP
jgi:hypothetical protein